MSKCKICGSNTEEVISFGKMPIANGFIDSPTDKEFFYDLKVDFCLRCFMVQLDDTVRAEMMFNEDYHFISSTSSVMAQHFKDVADEILDMVREDESPFVVELGCNDGIMLQHISNKGIRHLGVEPSGNVAQLARDRGLEVANLFFNRLSAAGVVEKYSQADVIYGANVMCHIEDMNSVFEGVNILLKQSGVLFFEDPYLLDIIKKSSFDQIYDEHVYYFSGLSVSELAQRHNMQLVDMVPQNFHGGSMRYYIKKGRQNVVSERVKKHMEEEKKFRLHEIQGYMDFKGRVESIRNDLKQTLLRLKQTGSRIVGYGATSKSTTLLNYAGIGPDLLEYISDITPTKINKYTPGMHIPVKPHDSFLSDFPSYALLLAWNHKDEIFEKEKEFRQKGGKFITYFPHVCIE